MKIYPYVHDYNIGVKSMEKKLRNMLFAIISCFIVVLGGCQDNNGMSTNKDMNNTTTEGTTTIQQNTNQDVKMMTKEEIVKHIEKKYNGKVTDIEVESTSTYEVDIVVGSEKRDLLVNGTNGEVVSDKVGGNVVASTIQLKQVAITKEQAEEMAIKQSGGGYLLKSELDFDDNMDIYEIKVVKDNVKYEYEVDANTGKIIELKQE
jgi:uncharacterized membrane protein YkoI